MNTENTIILQHKQHVSIENAKQEIVDEAEENEELEMLRSQALDAKRNKTKLNTSLGSFLNHAYCFIDTPEIKFLLFFVRIV